MKDSLCYLALDIKYTSDSLLNVCVGGGVGVSGRGCNVGETDCHALFRTVPYLWFRSDTHDEPAKPGEGIAIGPIAIGPSNYGEKGLVYPSM